MKNRQVRTILRVGDHMATSRQSHSAALAVQTTLIENSVAGDACMVFQMGGSPQALESFTEAVEARFSECDLKLESSSTSRGSATLGQFRVSIATLDPARVTISTGLQVPAGWVTVGDLPLFSVRLVTATGEKLIEVKTERMESNKPAQSETHRASELNIRV